jgi:hypothetical protein
LLNVTTTLPQTIGVALGGAVVTVGGGNFALFPDRHRLLSSSAPSRPHPHDNETQLSQQPDNPRHHSDPKVK